MADRVSAIVLNEPAPRGWSGGLWVTVALTVLLAVSLGYLLVAGTGIWGINVPVSWGFAITNFVWWIGIAHAGTLISAILLLLRQGWRTSVNRFAETMTVFAILCAALFPWIHLGRPWLVYWLLPYPNGMGNWPQFRSPLVWDVFAIGTYGVVSLLFWYIGMIPDLAILRDRTKGRARAVYGVLALGWRGSAEHWRRYRTSYQLLAGLATVLVVSVHTVVSFDFAVSNLSGWHSTIFPPYFVAGAMFSGFAMLLTLVIPVRAVYGLRELIPERHLENMAKILLATGLVVAYAYAVEIFTAFYSGNLYEGFTVWNRLHGPYAPASWLVLFCNVAATQLLWIGRVRRSAWALFLIAMAVNVGMWLERFVIVVTSQHRDFLPSSWGMFRATFWDWTTLAGSLGLFLALLLLFLRFLPAVSIVERVRGGAAGAAPVRVAKHVEGPLHGVLAEFRTPEELAVATRHMRELGYRALEAYSPRPVGGLATGSRSRLGLLTLASGALGAMVGYVLQYWVSVVEAPVNAGGRPLNSWPAFVPVTLECALLGAALAAAVGMVARNALPRLHHPVFGAGRFSLAGERYFLCVEAEGENFDPNPTEEEFQKLKPVEVSRVAG